MELELASLQEICSTQQEAELRWVGAESGDSPAHVILHRPPVRVHLL